MLDLNIARRIVARFHQALSKEEPQEALGAGTPRGWETRREREEAVTTNLDPHLLPLWRKTKYQFKGSPHQRYEKFMQFVHDQGGDLGHDATRALKDESEAKLQREIREYESRPYHEPPPEDYVPFA